MTNQFRSEPETSTGHRTSWLVLSLLLLGYLVLFAFYYPPTHGIEDEVGFINQGLIWSRGSLSAEAAGFDELDDTILVNGRHVGYRNPGKSLIVAPFVFFAGLTSVFLSGAIIHAGLCITAGFVLARLGKSPTYASLVLLHPTMAIYSRTVMGDAPSALCVLLAFAAVLATKRPGLWAGLALGAASVMRLHSIIFLPFLVIALSLKLPVKVRRRECIACILGGSVAIAVNVAYNMLLLDCVLAPFPSSSRFSLTFIPGNAAFYGIALFSIWPFMLLAPILVGSPLRPYVLVLTFPLLALLCGYYWYDRGTSLAETLVLGQRLLQPAIPVWVVAYAVVLDDLVVRRLRRALGQRVTAALVVATLIVLFSSVWMGFRAHQLHLQRFKAVRTEVTSIVPEGSLIIGNSTVRKLFGVPYEGVPAYRWSFLEYDADHSERIALEDRQWYLVVLPKSDADEVEMALSVYLDRYGMQLVPTASPGLRVYRADPVMSAPVNPPGLSVEPEL